VGGGGAHKKRTKDTLTVEHRGFRDNWTEENFSVSDAASPSQSPKDRCRLPSMLHPLVNTLCLIVSSDALNGDFYQVPHWCEQLALVWDFKTEMHFDMSGGDILFDKSRVMGTWSRMWDHNDMAQKWTTPSRVLDRLSQCKSTIRAEWLQEGTCEPTKMWLKGRCEPRSTLGKEWMICKHYLGKSSKDLK
jgi:hypothetical protein